MFEKIEKLLERLDEVEALLGRAETVRDQDLFKKLNKEHSYLSELRDTWDHYNRIVDELNSNKNLLLTEKDEELVSMIKEEIASLGAREKIYKRKLETLIVPPDPRDDRSVLLEIRAGTGGAEAALFVADCVKMYKGYSDRKGWRVDTIATTPSDLGGFKEYVMGISGKGAFRYLQYEGGTHRVQRVPATETQGRVHTSAVTVAVLLEPEKEDITIDESKDLKIDTYRASGAGGQHVNVTDSAVRITHIPSQVVVCCQDERSQHKNKAKALRLLYAKLAELKERESVEELSKKRQAQIGSGDRSEKIRTYNFPQNRVTDHRIDLTIYKLDQVLEGALDDIIDPLVSYFYQKKLST